VGVAGGGVIGDGVAVAGGGEMDAVIGVAVSDVAREGVAAGGSEMDAVAVAGGGDGVAMMVLLLLEEAR